LATKRSKQNQCKAIAPQKMHISTKSCNNSPLSY
jgi:hypothetical protein